jgi:hypothetical protein
VELVLIQFPTPYRLPSSLDTLPTNSLQQKGNSQLPTTAFDGFMVTDDLLKLASGLLQGSESGRPGVILQSNCEDVAVWMRSTATIQAKLQALELNEQVESLRGTPTKRTLNWIGMGGERASGAGWSVDPLLPRKGRTETEIACMLNDTPVHRCFLVPTLSTN